MEAAGASHSDFEFEEKASPMSEKHIIFGCSGPIGVGLMECLAATGYDVVGVCRSGESEAPTSARIERGDLRDTETVKRLADGASVVYGCVGIPYPDWPREWPPIIEGLMTAAESSGARLVFADNLYCYGPQDVPLREDLPYTESGKKPALRARLARTMLAAHATGRARIALVRASDFYGPRVRSAALGERFFPNLLAGKSADLLGDANQPHSFTFAADFCRALQLVAEADDDVYGQAWHVPNAPSRTQREIVEMTAELCGTQAKSRSLRGPVLSLIGLIDPIVRELKEMMPQWERPYLVDHSKWEARFGANPTPMEEGLRATVEWYRLQR